MLMKKMNKKELMNKKNLKVEKMVPQRLVHSNIYLIVSTCPRGTYLLGV